MAKTKKHNHICLYADFGCTTGFGKVTKELVDAWNSKLGKDVHLVIFAINDQATEPYDYKNAMVVPANALKIEGNPDAYHRLAFLHFIQENDFNVVMFINDLELLRTIHPHLKDLKKHKKENNKLDFKTVAYFPIDSLPKKSDVEILSFFDETVTYTEYAKQALIDLVPSLKQKIKIAAHGTDTKTFHKIDSEAIQKKKIELFGENKFVFGTVNRNSCRKDIATTILAFKAMKNQYGFQENAVPVLYLHMNIFDYYGINIPHFCERIGLELGKDIFYPKMFSENKGIEESELNEIYNTFDVFITNTTAEGWGLTVTEAMACEIPVICPIHTSLTEITKDGEIVIPIRRLEPVVFVNDSEKVRFKSDLQTTIDNMFFCYTSIVNGVGMQEMTTKALEHVSKYKWKTAANYFWVLFEKYFK